MKRLTIAVVVFFAFGLGLAGTIPPEDGIAPIHIAIDPPGEGGGGAPGVLPAGIDADLDGFVASLDCNDDAADVNPMAVEKANGVDDNCNGVVDEGLDTTFDWPHVDLAAATWPQPGTASVGQHLSIESQPRLVWTGEAFMAAWVDLRNRLRVAHIGLDGVLADTPATLRSSVSNLDVAWTGSRLGIVCEDVSIPGAPSVRLMTVDGDGIVQGDVVIAALGREPKIAWGQDEFGVIWSALVRNDSLRFQRFGPTGEALSAEEVLPHSGGSGAIAFDGTIVTRLAADTYSVHEGMFGVAYEFRCGHEPAGEAVPYASQPCQRPAGDVFLSAFSRDAETAAPIGPVRVNLHNDPQSSLGAMPAIAANQSGFLVAWHAVVNGKDAAQSRYFTHDTLAPSQELTPDADAARYGRLTWTGAEFVMLNDNRTSPAAETYNVHLRRFDADGNTHVTSPKGAWTELNLRDFVRGSVSAHPDAAIANGKLGVVWVERDEVLGGTAGTLWFAVVSHQ
jgi:hypothetical protein